MGKICTFLQILSAILSTKMSGSIQQQFRWILLLLLLASIVFFLLPTASPI